MIGRAFEIVILQSKVFCFQKPTETFDVTVEKHGAEKHILLQVQCSLYFALIFAGFNAQNMDPVNRVSRARNKFEGTGNGFFALVNVQVGIVGKIEITQITIQPYDFFQSFLYRLCIVGISIVNRKNVVSQKL